MRWRPRSEAIDFAPQHLRRLLKDAHRQPELVVRRRACALMPASMRRSRAASASSDSASMSSTASRRRDRCRSDAVRVDVLDEGCVEGFLRAQHRRDHAADAEQEAMRERAAGRFRPGDPPEQVQALDDAAHAADCAVVVSAIRRSISGRPALDRAARGRVHLPRDAAGEIGEPAREDRVLHRLRHRDRLLRAGNGGVHQHAVGAELHRQRRVRCRADAGVDDERHARELADDADVVGVLDAEARADRRAERHDRRRAGVLQLAAGDRIVVRVRQHDEALP